LEAQFGSSASKCHQKAHLDVSRPSACNFGGGGSMNISLLVNILNISGEKVEDMAQ